MSDVSHLLVQKHDYSAFFFPLEELGPCGCTYSISLQDHPEFFQGLASSPVKSSEAIVVLFPFGYDVA